MSNGPLQQGNWKASLNTGDLETCDGGQPSVFSEKRLQQPLKLSWLFQVDHVTAVLDRDKGGVRHLAANQRRNRNRIGPRQLRGHDEHGHLDLRQPLDGADLWDQHAAIGETEVSV